MIAINNHIDLRSGDHTQTLIEDLTAKRGECIELQQKYNSLNLQVDTLLEQNSELIMANQQLINQTPETVIKYVKKTNVNRRASEQFVQLLTKRYVIE